MHIGFPTQVGTQVGQTGFCHSCNNQRAVPWCVPIQNQFAVCGDTGPLTQHPMMGISGSQLQKHQRAPLLVSFPPQTHASLTVVWGIVTFYE